MKALTIHQPFASLIATGMKAVETRHWAPPARLVGERIAIHAAKTTVSLPLLDLEPMRSHLPDELRGVEMPLGTIVATAVLSRVQSMVDARWVDEFEARDPAEHAFGFYTEGRYAWHLADVQPLHDLPPVRGAQGFWTIPAGVLPATTTERTVA